MAPVHLVEEGVGGPPGGVQQALVLLRAVTLQHHREVLQGGTLLNEEFITC